MYHTRHRPVRHITHLPRSYQVTFEPAFWNRQGSAYERPGIASIRRGRCPFAVVLALSVDHANIAPTTQGGYAAALVTFRSRRPRII